jgi:hypothetical protein
MNHQTALIPWVQSIVFKHYILGKEVFLQRQDNYIGLYRFLNNFYALYLTCGLGHIIGNDISRHPQDGPYSESDCHNPNSSLILTTLIWTPKHKTIPL